METYAAPISETLQKYGSCVLPGIGRLELSALPAERSFQDNTLHPPTFKIILTGGGPGPSVVDQIALDEGLDHREAEKRWQNAVAEIRAKLSTGSSVVLNGLGWLNLAENGGITFVSSLPPSLFYDSVPLKPPHEAVAPARELTGESEPLTPVVVSEQPPLSVPEEPMDTREASRARWWIAGSIAVLLVIGWFTYMGTKVRERKKDSLSEILNEKQADQGERLDSMKQSIDSMRTAHRLGRDSIHYKIIIASYDNKEKAEHQYRRMKQWGHPVELIIKKDSTYELAWPFTSRPSDTTVNMVKMMNLYGKNIHIEYDNR